MPAHRPPPDHLPAHHPPPHPAPPRHAPPHPAPPRHAPPHHAPPHHALLDQAPHLAPPTAEVLRRYGARFLDPSTAVVLRGQRLRSTTYLADRLILPASGPALGAIRAAADRLRLAVELPDNTDQPGVPADLLGMRIRLIPRPGRAVTPDAWAVLQLARATAGLDALRGAGLDHLIHGPAHPIPTHDHPASTHDSPIRAYDTPIRAYETPIRAYDAPMHRHDSPNRGHDSPIQGYDSPGQGYDSPIRGYDSPMITGTLRAEPRAEADLIHLLGQLHRFAVAQHAAGRPSQRIDTVVLPCRFHPEEPIEPTGAAPLAVVLRRLNALGIVVAA